MMLDGQFDQICVLGPGVCVGNEWQQVFTLVEGSVGWIEVVFCMFFNWHTMNKFIAGSFLSILDAFFIVKLL